MSCLDEHDVIRNRFTIATSVFGGIALVLCIITLVVIISYRKTGVSLRDRILAGLLTANSIYSFANLVPVEYDTCGHYGSLSGLNQLGIFAGHRGLWFAGKFMIVFYEMFIVGASVVAFRVGASSWQPWKEALAHLTCIAAGVVSFTAFVVLTLPYERSRRDARDRLQNPTLNQTEKDDLYRLVAKSDDGYNDVEKNTIQIWIGFLVLALGLWVASRMSYYYTVLEWKADYASQQRQWDRDLWAPENASQREQKNRLVLLQKEAYDNVARPLELYVVVFIVFAIPAITMATDYCQRISDENGHCYDPCVMLLALRSIGTALAYFREPLHRTQLCDCTRLWQGFALETGNACLCCINLCKGTKLRIQKMQCISRSGDAMLGASVREFE